MGNTITAVFKEGSLSTRATGLWQWDYGQILEIVGLPLPRSVELHIVQKSNMISRIGLTEDEVTRVAIPDDYLETSDPITIYVYLHTGEDDGETEYRIILPIIPRPKPVDYDTEDHEVSVAYQALVDATALMNGDIEAVRAMKNTTEQYMNTAGTKAEEAGQAATEAVDAATEAMSWAVGGTGSRDGEDTNNSKWWSEKAAESAEEVKAYLTRETTTQIGRVTEEGNRQVQRVNSIGSEAINAIGTAGNEQITAIDAAGNGQIEDIEAIGLTQKNAVKAEGERQIQDISNTKDSVVTAVTAEGDKQVGIIAAKESEITGRITAAGDSQVDRVKQMGTTQYYAIGSLSSQQKIEIQNLGNQTKNAVSVLANTAKSYAVGDSGTRPGENTDNAKYYSERAGELVRTIDDKIKDLGAQADWNQTDTTASDYIKNKPTIPEQVTVDTALSNTSTNPVQNKVIKAELDRIAGLNVQADWNQTDTTASDYIKNKPTIPAAITVDAAISDTSTNPVQNKVIKTEFDSIRALIGNVETLLSAI